MKLCKYGTICWKLVNLDERYTNVHGIILFLPLFCRFECFQIKIWGKKEIRMQRNQNVSKNQIEKRNRGLVLENLSSCHSYCHRAVVVMLVNAERLEHTIGWQAPFGQCKYYVFSRYLKFVFTIHPFLSIHISLIWTNGRWVSQSRMLKRKFECLPQAIWWPSLIIFKDVFFFFEGCSKTLTKLSDRDTE